MSCFRFEHAAMSLDLSKRIKNHSKEVVNCVGMRCGYVYRLIVIV